MEKMRLFARSLRGRGSGETAWDLNYKLSLIDILWFLEVYVAFCVFLLIF